MRSEGVDESQETTTLHRGWPPFIGSASKIRLPDAGTGSTGDDTACAASLVDSALASLHASLCEAAGPLLRPDIIATALPDAILPHAGDVFALRASLAAVSAAVAAPERRIERTQSSGRCASSPFVAVRRAQRGLMAAARASPSLNGLISMP